MNKDIILYAYPFRSRAERVLWALKELGLDYELLRLPPFVDDQPNPKLVELNPNAKVPILVHKGRVLLESLAIIEYLNSISEHSSLIPTGSRSLYEFRRTLHYGLTEIEPYLWIAEQANGPLKEHYYWPEGMYEESIRRVKHSCDSVAALIVGETHILRQGFSMADIYYYHILTWAMQHHIRHSKEIEAYLSHLEKRPGFPQAMYWQ